jgi:integrase
MVSGPETLCPSFHGTNGKRGYMKDRKLLVTSLCTRKKFYLFRPNARSDFHIKFTPPRPVREQLAREGKRIGRICRTTHTSELAAAKAIAAQIIKSFWMDAGREAEKLKGCSDFVTIGKLIERYRKHASQRPGTVRSNVRSLLNIVQTVLGGGAEQRSTSVLTKELIREFEQKRLAKAGADAVSQQRVRFSTGSYVRQARSVVALRKMKFYDGLKLPDLTGFRTESVEAPKRSRPRPLDMTLLTAMILARPALAEADPGAYVANLMFSHWGMRDIEIWNARAHWIDNGVMHIIDRAEEGFYPKGCERSFEIDAGILKEILRFQHLCVHGYLVPGKDKTERHRAIYRRHSKWVSTWIKNHRKTSYELRRFSGSRLLDMGATIFDVRDFLGHRDVQTTQQWYAYRLQNRKLPTIGMNDLVPNEAVA